MANEKLLQAIKQAREGPKRKFTQSFDLTVNLDVNPKEKISVEEMVTLPAKLTRQYKVYALVGGELKAEAESTCDRTIMDASFEKFATPRHIRNLAREAEYFIAQADMMPAIAKIFGKYFAPIGRMPNPKFGMIVPPKGAKLSALVTKLKQSAVLKTKRSPTIQVRIGDEKMSDEDLASNAEVVISLLEAKLPRGKSNIKNSIIKTTMGRPIKV